MGHQGFVSAHLPGGIAVTGPDLLLVSYKFPDNKYKLHAAATACIR